MGSKDFQKGMEAGAKPFEDEFSQVGQKLDDITAEYGASGDLEEERIFGDVTINDGQKVTYENKDILISSKLNVGNNAELTFKNCKITCDRAISQEIGIRNETSNCNATFINCTIEWENYNYKLIDFYDIGSVTFQNCVIIGNNFASVSAYYETKLNVKDSKVQLTFTKDWKHSAAFQAKLTTIENTSFITSDNENINDYARLFSNDDNVKLNVDKCSFENLTGRLLGDLARDSYFNDCEFENCTLNFTRNSVHENRIYNYTYRNCTFAKCLFKESSVPYYKALCTQYDNVTMTDCNGYLFSPTYMNKLKIINSNLSIMSLHPIKMIDCEFKDMEIVENREWEYGLYTDVQDIDSAIHFTGASEVINCKFENLIIDEDYLFEGYPDCKFERYEFDRSEIRCPNGLSNPPSLNISNSSFINISTSSGELLNDTVIKGREDYGFAGLKTRKFDITTSYDIEDCTGL